MGHVFLPDEYGSCIFARKLVSDDICRNSNFFDENRIHPENKTAGSRPIKSKIIKVYNP